MFPLQNTKTVNIVAQAQFTTSQSATGLIDTLGFDEVAVDVFLDSAGATSSNPATLKLQECDTSNGSFANITGLVGDATDGFTIPLADTAAAQIVRMNCDTRHRKRYLKLIATPDGAAQIIGATAVLGKAGDSTVARAAQAAVADA